MNQTFLLDIAVGGIALLGGLGLALGLAGLALGACRRRALHLLLWFAPAGLLGVLGLYALTSLTGTPVTIRLVGIAFLCGAGVATIGWGTLSWIMYKEAPGGQNNG